MRWSPRLLDALSAVSALAALAFLLLPVGTTPDVGASAPSLPAGLSVARSAPRTATVDSSSTVIVSTNVFSASRRAPSVRFKAPGSELDVPAFGLVGAGTAPTIGMPDVASHTDAATSDEVPQLFGVVVTDDAPRALLGLVAGEPPRLLAVGDRNGGYRVIAIDADRVVLSSAGGVRTLRLARRAPRDTSRTLP